jgi:hypothetical protein
MRPPYISIFATICTLILSGCAGWPDVSKDPHSLASRVGNFSPVKLNAENAERKAAKFVTPLPKGTRDLDGRQENFDPAFGSPETESEAAALDRLSAQDRSQRSGSNSRDSENSSAYESSEQAAANSKEQTQRNANQNVSAVNQKAPSPERIISSPSSMQALPLRPGADDSTEFGKSQNGRTTVFMDAPAARPIVEAAPKSSNPAMSQGFGCPPAGVGSVSQPQSPQTRIQTAAGSPLPNPGLMPRQPRLQPQQQQVMLFRTPPQNPPERKNILQGQAPGSAYEGPPAFAPSYDAAGMDTCDDLALVTAQNQRAKNVRITVTARVKRLLPDDRQGNPHQRFLLGLSNGTTVLVAHNIDLAPYVPLQQGDSVTICGEYIWNEKGGVLHYTHHTTNSRHQGGYIQYNRQTYQ